MEELGRNIFWAFFSEILFFILAIILKEDKRKVVIVLIVGTLISGAIGFWLPALQSGSNDDNLIANGNTPKIGGSRIKEVYADQIINSYDQNGVRVHAVFEVDNRAGVSCVILVFFFDESGDPIAGYNGSPIQKNGQIAVGREFTPNSDSVEASTMFFIPIEELHLENGSSTIKYQVEIYELSSGALLVKSDLSNFTITE